MRVLPRLGGGVLSTKSKALLNRCSRIRNSSGKLPNKISLLAALKAKKPKEVDPDGTNILHKETPKVPSKSEALVKHKIKLRMDMKREEEGLEEILKGKVKIPTQGREDSQRFSHPSHVELVKALVVGDSSNSEVILLFLL